MQRQLQYPHSVEPCLIVLSLLLFAVAYKTAKQKSNSAGKLFIGLIGTFALVAAGGGIKLVTDVEACGMDVPLSTRNTDIQITKQHV